MTTRVSHVAGLLCFVLCCVSATVLTGQGLFIDFTRTGGPVAAGYQGYFATHEQPATFTAQSYAAFGVTVIVAPAWNGTLQTGQNPQMIDRNSQGDFYRDWIGTDTRGANVANDPMTLTLTGLPAGAFEWVSYHHDPNDQTQPFDLTITDASGTRVFTGIDISNGSQTPTTVHKVLWSDGINPITLVFDGTDEAFFVFNGFDIPTNLDTDDDGLLDPWEIDYFGNLVDQDGAGDPDGDGATNKQEQTAGTDPNDDDSDNDTLLDGAELMAGTDPANPDTDGDGRTDGEEVNGLVPSNPLLPDSDGDLIGDLDEVNNGSDPLDPMDYPVVPHLQIDFAASPEGPLELFYQPYLALHEVNSLNSDPVGGDPLGVDRLDEPYAAFGTPVRLSVSYPNLDRVTYTEDQLKTVKQMYDRGSGWAAAYSGTKSNLVRTWIGTDARTGSNGNGPDTPTTLRLAIDGLPAGDYVLRTYHHDVQNQHGTFGIRVTDADSTGQLLSDKFRQTTSSGSNLADPGAGNGPERLRSTVVQVIRANGTDPVTVDFEKKEAAGSAEQSFFVMNGLEIDAAVDSDQDDIDDATEIALFGNLSQDGTTDFDHDMVSDGLEILLNLDPADSDTDDDGLSDAEELGSSPVAARTITITSFNLDRQIGVVSLNWTPEVAVDYEVRTSIDGPPLPVIVSGDTPPVSFPIPSELAGMPQLFLRLVGPPAGVGSNPFLGDTDGDGVGDGEEINTYASDPLDTDSDDDGFSDGREAADGSSLADPASVPDQDGDGFSNAREVAGGSDPNDPDSVPVPPVNALFVDFNSNQDDGGDSATDPNPALSQANHNQTGYQSYHANHEVHAEFAAAAYAAFGTNVTLQPFWPDTTDARVEQSLDRNDQDAAGVVLGSNDANWQGDQINLITDWLGVDTRTGSGGNGDYDGITGNPTRMSLRIAGLPAGEYSWRSYHHDTENVHGEFLVEISTDGGATFTQVVGPGPAGSFSMTDSTSGGTPASAVTYTGFPSTGSSDPAALPSTVNTSFTADGVQDVVVRFTPLPNTAVHKQLWGINGFELVLLPR
ncbi:MAG: hypothetical protein JXQ71_15620 [Verrucomicrobia bacterium]|nr:hypothetical protein [Verrucomicrobiota bacterium]